MMATLLEAIVAGCCRLIAVQKLPDDAGGLANRDRSIVLLGFRLREPVMLRYRTALFCWRSNVRR